MSDTYEVPPCIQCGSPMYLGVPHGCILTPKLRAAIRAAALREAAEIARKEQAERMNAYDPWSTQAAWDGGGNHSARLIAEAIEALAAKVTK